MRVQNGHFVDGRGKRVRFLASNFTFGSCFPDHDTADKLAAYDVVFLTCGGVPDDWLGRRIGGAERGAAGSFHAKRKKADELNKALRSFVGRGGTLYVSDWQFQLLDIAFPEFIDSAKRTKGDIQTVRAEVVDSGLIRRLGSTIELRFSVAIPASRRAPRSSRPRPSSASGRTTAAACRPTLATGSLILS